MPAARGRLGIGEVVALLQPDFPDVSISKVRFLEAEGLVTPERTASGYRKFSPRDVERLRYVLTMQRDHYLPLKVIRDHLEVGDRGLEPARDAGGRPRVPESLAAGESYVPLPPLARAPSDVRLTRDELLEASELSADALAAAEGAGLIARTADHYDGHALVVARAVAELGRYGLEPRHLRAFRGAADREVGLIEQALAPLAAQRSPEARERATAAAADLAAQTARLHAALVQSALARAGY